MFICMSLYQVRHSHTILWPLLKVYAGMTVSLVRACSLILQHTNTINGMNCFSMASDRRSSGGPLIQCIAMHMPR